jgi:hypothetical protein
VAFGAPLYVTSLPDFGRASGYLGLPSGCRSDQTRPSQCQEHGLTSPLVGSSLPFETLALPRKAPSSALLSDQNAARPAPFVIATISTIDPRHCHPIIVVRKLTTHPASRKALSLLQQSLVFVATRLGYCARDQLQHCPLSPETFLHADSLCLPVHNSCGRGFLLRLRG